MLLIRLSGHSGAGKSRLLAALPKQGFAVRRPIIYTSRAPRVGEIHGLDYYFMSRGFIEKLPKEQFLVGDVRSMVQAIDLVQLAFELRSGDPVIAEIFHTRWPPLKQRMIEMLGSELRTISVFLTALPPDLLRQQDRPSAESFIRKEVTRTLTWRNKDSVVEIRKRAESAVQEILEALKNPSPYDQVIFSAPEGPDGEDEWTIQTKPQGQAAVAIDEFLTLVERTLKR